MTERAPTKNGFALLLVLWTMVLLSLIVIRLASAGRTEAQLAGNVRDAAVTESAADGAVQEAAFHLLAIPGSWTTGGTTQTIALPGVSVAARIESEDGRVNPNLASPELLAAILRQAGADVQTATAIAAAIVEWRFPGAATRDGPAVRAYAAAGLPYAPPGLPFRNLEEVRAVRGMTPDLFNRIAPFLSVFTTGDPDPAEAPPEVLAAIRAATGRLPPSDRGNALPTVIRITATASGPNNARFTRRARLALNRQNATPLRILAWDVPGP